MSLQLFVLPPFQLGFLQGLTLKTLREPQEALVLHSRTRDKCCWPQGFPMKRQILLGGASWPRENGSWETSFCHQGIIVAVRLPVLLNISDPL